MLRLTDAGLYECQANTEPKDQFPINLIIEDTVAVISGDDDNVDNIYDEVILTTIRSPGGVPEGRQPAATSLCSAPG